MTVVVVESPSKAKTINKYLGKDYTVLASYGHVRDLPPKDGSVRPDEDFAMSWEVDGKSAKRVSDIAAALKDTDRLILATDPDREGEAISWHVLEILKKKGALKGKEIDRVVFNAITKQSVLEAMKHPRQVDVALVDAYLARRALDYLVGFTLSPVLWRKLPGSRSAGRVQSVALRLICDRELEIEAFRAQEYWTIDGAFTSPRGDAFAARLAAIDGKRLGKLDIGNEASATAIVSALKGAHFAIDSVESKPVKRHPYPPFRTATLQQEASRKLGFSSAKTMQVAQRLYEGVNIGGEVTGLITYMRTDGVDLAGEAIAATRNAILKRFGEPYLPSVPRKYTTKAKNAQEAHEAIRPTDLFRFPENVRRILDPDQMALYELIWKRTIASQMESAEIERTTADIGAKGNDGKAYSFRATGSVVKFDGFLKLYQEGLDDEEDEDSRRLPALARGDGVGVKSITPEQHFTEPPPRYSEASLIKKMEELGIGRPSTYTAIFSVLRDRGYVRVDKKRLVPEDKGRLVTAFLEAFFKRYVEYDFTANLEEQLDRISNGEIDWKAVLRDFWLDFTGAVGEIQELRITNVLDALNEILGPHVFPERADGQPARTCPSCSNGQLSLKLGKFGAFVGCSNYPDCRFTRQITPGNGEGEAVPAEGLLIGHDPETGQPVTRRDGRFGPYLQLGEAAEGEKPRRASIPKKTDPASIDLETALRLLSLPRDVGVHPETGKPIVANFGRFGPFILHDGTYATLSDPEEVYTVGLNRAVTLLAEKKEKSANRKRPGALKDLGQHPDGGPVHVMSGRYGAYVKWGKINATIPAGKEPEETTLEEAVILLAARAGKGKAKKAAKPRAAKAPAKKAPAKKAAAKRAKKATSPDEVSA
ncbi:type I DNA topoisomerase [Taklimakanibacter albus]|uniref:Type I DNA topoisomerase n=1 Tax=Taklimakanibacter albus TaxID=2800327 RepID=A0ACC5R215_9HYPH|nr:type I DNA topoisomerase [Aestuariivirga sp. YIM B02566]MBK1866453.1 type I DNA topoisomerase [Aestuariivirga sp. YIM B02566]